MSRFASAALCCLLVRAVDSDVKLGVLINVAKRESRFDDQFLRLESCVVRQITVIVRRALVVSTRTSRKEDTPFISTPLRNYPVYDVWHSRT